MADDQYAELITGFPIFRGYTEAGARRLMSYGTIGSHSAGEVLFKEGDPPSHVLLLLTGKLQVYVERGGKDLVLTDAGPSSILGELAVLCGIPRSACVRVLEDSNFLRWDASEFRRMLLSDTPLSERIFREALKTLIEKEKSLIASLSGAGASSR